MKISPKDARKIVYINDTKNRLATYFIYKSDIVPIPRNIEILLRENGTIGWATKHKKWVIGQFNGVVDENNEPTTYVCTSLNTENKSSYQLKNHEEVIVLRNNPMGLSDRNIIEWDAEMRAENDVSMFYQLVNSRNIPVIVAPTDQVKAQVERVFENITAGKPCVITTDLINDIEVKDIIDHDAISKMECLNELNEVLTKRALNWFGGTLDIKDKKAQVTSTELKAYDDFTTIGFLTNYECRKEFCEEMTENGFPIECIRNPIFTDEPTNEEIESGEMEESKDETDNSERDLEVSAAEEQANDDD